MSYQSSYDPAFNSLVDVLAGRHSNSQQLQDVLHTQLGSLADQFSTSFQNMVGRAPTQDEINHFMTQSGAGTLQTATGDLHSSVDQTQLGNLLSSYVGQNYQQAAQDTAVQKLQAQQGQANQLGDLFEQQGNSAINDTENALLDYQSKLFDKLRPNLLTSLKSQGLLDTGGLNEAEAGVQGDLANNASQYIAGLKLNNAQGANQIRFGGASAPYYYQQGLISNQPNLAMQQGQYATNFNNNTFMSNLAYQQQLGAIQANANAARSGQPSMLRTFEQGIATNPFVGSTSSSTSYNGSSGPSGGGSGNSSKATGIASLFS